MSVFSSLQTLAEKYESSRQRAIDLDVPDALASGAFVESAELRERVRDELWLAWPLLEAAVKSLEEIRRLETVYRRDTSDGNRGFRQRVRAELANPALFSLTGEPR